MKRLILVRHAKSSWESSDVADKDRPLNQRGIEAAAKLGTWLAKHGHQPDQVLSSSAARCRQTWDGIAEGLGAVKDVSFTDFLYLASPPELLKALKSASGKTVLILAHMPGVGEFVRDMRRDPPPMHDMFKKYPTGAATVLEFRTDDWDDVQAGTGVFVEYVTPRDI
ncbi:MAG: histidine phosphatase family protein [Alphaproteobacteria bacterium]|nr:histidine phosphatase family protein [Alphaproteobacteria bacterium]